MNRKQRIEAVAAQADIIVGAVQTLLSLHNETEAKLEYALQRIEVLNAQIEQMKENEDAIS